MPRVFIGVGHGGRDPGAVGYVVEKDANLVMALEVKRVLEDYGVTVGISRTNDSDGTTTASVAMAKKFLADLAVEIHNNAGGGDGFEVYVQTNARYSGASRDAGKAVEARVIAAGQNSRGVKTKLNSAGTADYYGWLRNNDCPAVLIEGFFVDNATDAAGFDTIAEQQALGRAYALGILDYFGVLKRCEQSSEWAKTATEWAVNSGIFVGDGKGKFNWKDPITREEAAVILYRFLWVLYD